MNTHSQLTPGASQAEAIQNAQRAATAAEPQALGKMRDLALKVVELLRPYCCQIEIAGSIRRQRPVCGDIDLVVLPKHGQYGALESAVTELAGNSGLLLKNGRVLKQVLLRKSRVQCDVWIADHGTEGDMLTPGLPCNWGAMLVTYTGSVAHNIKLVEAAKEKGWRWNPTRGLAIPMRDTGSGIRDAGVEMVSVDEAVILERVFGRWVEPGDRF